jgi:hypothetical protein
MDNERPNIFPQNNGGDKPKQIPAAPDAESNSGENYYAEMMRREREKAKNNPEYIDLDEPLGGVIETPAPQVQHPPVNNEVVNKSSEIEYYVEPDYDSDFDIIPLPSEGKTYKHKKGEIKVSYLTASDENILTNPNLIKSGKFLDVLFQRKIIDRNFKYEDLLQGDKDAIMLWLRSTAYGSDYTIEVMDPKELEPFEVQIDLNDIKTIKLGAEPDEEGLFEFTLPVKKNVIKFKLLTVGDLKKIEAYQDRVTREQGEDHVNLATYTLKTVVVEVDGVRDRSVVDPFCEKMRLGDAKAFKKYVDKIESGKDFNLTVQAPGGGLVKTFFPLNTSFFWPES